MFAGLFGYPNAPVPDAWVDIKTWKQILHPYLTPDCTGHWCQANASLVESQHFSTPWSHHTQRMPWQEDKLAVAFWGRLDNRAELTRQLELDSQPSATLLDAQLVLAGWHRWGKRLPEQLLGDFALAIIDTEAHQLFLARDPLGVKPLYYWPHSQGLLFATTVRAFCCLKALEPTPDSDWMARYLLHLSMSHSCTSYREILKLPPGHFLIVDGESHQQLHRYHQWQDDAPTTYQRDPQWLEAYRAVLEESIRCRMASNYPLGTENSGGIDSASITAYLARFLGEPGDRLHSFGFALSEHEPAYILETSQYVNITHNYLVTAWDTSDSAIENYMGRTLQVIGYPQEKTFGTGHTPFYRECQLRGIRTLFSGYGGDEVISNPGHHLRWELLDSHDYGNLWKILPGNPLWRFLRLSKAVTLGRKHPDYNPNFLRAWIHQWSHQLLRQDVVERLGLYEAYLETARYDAPFRRINDWIINGLLQMPYISTRLEISTLVAGSYGIDYCWPLWDVRLVQQYLSTPSLEKVGPQGIGRYLHRRAISGTVPQRVAWKPNKNMGYARAHQAMNDIGIQSIAERARGQAANLHPAVAELIDQNKWCEQIKRAQQGKVSAEFGFGFWQSTLAIQWLNQWLHGRPVG
ncbi:hypothetical protein GS597_16385 [Synechococcales cyanobacterium C]|uniref:asparagine synthase (glutamine-hydrolyzing) n=1 Tax=Petrachloros mirabilis ULC683 TaxID=2781853 RepID=A0A8K2A200_9CYAN|nr:asparagine synthase-related protein [Petrachloros mirabilis]NCJ08057.1 hypothetical protein [Petrachloros mirabilis ULC683]